MKELMHEYADYNIWANNLVIEAMLKLPENSVTQTINSSFQSLRATTLHCWSAEDIWLQRLMQAENPFWSESIFKGSFEDACSNWQVVSIGVAHYVANLDEIGFMANLSYRDMQQNPHTTPVFQILLHVFNHATYHRGQLITMLRQVGETTVPRTDFIVFARMKESIRP